MDDLTAAAELWGVESGYHDVFGGWHSASPETLARLTTALSGGRERPPRVDTAAWPADPVRAFQGDGRRLWALAAQLYAVRSRRNWGHGDFSDLEQLVGLAASCGASGIGLNPLHALFRNAPKRPAPTHPTAGCISIRSISTSRRFRNSLASRRLDSTRKLTRCARRT